MAFTTARSELLSRSRAQRPGRSSWERGALKVAVFLFGARFKKLYVGIRMQRDLNTALMIPMRTSRGAHQEVALAICSCRLLGEPGARRSSGLRSSCVGKLVAWNYPLESARHVRGALHIAGVLCTLAANMFRSGCMYIQHVTSTRTVSFVVSC